MAFIGRLDPEKGICEVIALFERLAQDPHIHTSIYGYTWKHLPVSQKIEQYLRAHKSIRYVPRAHHNGGSASEADVQETLRHIDVMVLPYKAFRRTLDPPLLLLESLASLCVTITRPVGSVARFAADPEGLIAGPDFVPAAYQYLDVVKQSIPSRREKLRTWNASHGCRASQAADLFLRHLTGEE